MPLLHPRQTRLRNAWKLNTHALYMPPFRRGIPWILGLLSAFQICVFGAAIALAILSINASSGIGFAHWVLIPLATLLVSLLDLVQRFQRTITPVRVVASAAIMAALWFVYIFLGLLSDYVDYLFAVLAAPGLAASLTYLALASFAWARQRKLGDKTQQDVAGVAGEVELDTHAAASTRSRSSERPGQKAVNVETQTWSPLK